MRQVSVFDAKTHFSHLIEEVYRYHETLTITRRGQAVAKIVPIDEPSIQRSEEIMQAFKVLKGQISKSKKKVTLKEMQTWKNKGRR